MTEDGLIERYGRATDMVMQAATAAKKGDIADSIILGRAAIELLEETIEVDPFDHPGKDEALRTIAELHVFMSEVEELLPGTYGTRTA